MLRVVILNKIGVFIFICALTVLVENIAVAKAIRRYKNYIFFLRILVFYIKSFRKMHIKKGASKKVKEIQKETETRSKNEGNIKDI